MPRLRLGRKSARRPLIEALEDRSLPSVVSFGELASDAADRGADAAQPSQVYESRDHGSGQEQAWHEQGRDADKPGIALDSATSREMAALQADEARHGKTSEARAEQKSSSVRETRGARDELRQDRQRDAKQSRGRNDEDRQQRKAMRDEFKAAYRQTRAGDEDKKASRSKAEDKKNDDDDDGAQSDQQQQAVIRIVERKAVIESHASTSETADVSERTAEVKSAAGHSPANSARVKIDDGQFVFSDDKTTLFQGVLERSTEITRAQLDFPEAASKSDSHRLAIEDLGRGAAGSLGGRRGISTEPIDEARFTIASYAAGEGISAGEEPGTLVGAGFASGEMQVSTSALDEALHQFAVGADDVVRSLARGLSGSAVLPWLLAAGAAAVATLEMQRRRKRLQSSIPEKPSLAADSELRWTPGMPGSFSDDHA